MEARPLDTAEALTGVEALVGLEPDVRQQLIATAVPRTYRKGQVLFEQGDPGDSLIILRRGAVSVFRTSPSGERALLSVVRPPDVLGELSLLDGSPRSASAEAIEDVTALALPRSAFLALVHSNPAILDAVMRSLGRLIRRLTEMNADHVFLDLPGRVAKALVRLAGDSNAPMVTIELNQSQLAEMAGGSRQSVNQAIGSFAGRSWLRTEGRRIVVTDLPALRRRAGMPGTRIQERAQLRAGTTSIVVDAYLDTEDSSAARRVIDAIDNIAVLLGYDAPVEEQWFTGSVWRRARAKLRGGMTSDEVRRRLVKIERALELAVLDRRQAAVDVKAAEAVTQLIASLNDIPQACLRVGSILIVKYHDGGAPILFSRSLTQTEIQALDRYPEIQTKPQSVLEGLATAIASLPSPDRDDQH